MMNGLENWALNAYADGELDFAERAAVEKQLAENPEARLVLESIQRQKALLHKTYDADLGDTVPHSLTKLIEGGGTRRIGPYAAMAASVALLILGGSGGWIAAQQYPVTAVESFSTRAINAHTVYTAEFKHPVEVPASEQEHLQTWLSKRVGTPFKIPDLSSKGYSFIGGRLLAEDGTPAGFLMYEDAAKKRLTMYVAANIGEKPSAMLIEYRGKLMSCYWAELNLVYAIVGEQTAEIMLPIAELAHDGFDS